MGITFFRDNVTIYCDSCEEEAPSADNFDEARENAKEAGFITIKSTDGEWLNFCCEQCMQDHKEDY